LVPLHGPQPQIQGIDADEWSIPGVSQGFGDGQPDPQAGERTWAVGHGNRGGPPERLAGHPIQRLQGGDQADGGAGIGGCDGHGPHDLRRISSSISAAVKGRRAEFRQADRGLGVAAIDHQQEGRLWHQFTGILTKVIVHDGGRHRGGRCVGSEPERTGPRGWLIVLGSLARLPPDSMKSGKQHRVFPSIETLEGLLIFPDLHANRSPDSRKSGKNTAFSHQSKRLTRSATEKATSPWHDPLRKNQQALGTFRCGKINTAHGLGGRPTELPV
jgi:hypothetical protein